MSTYVLILTMMTGGVTSIDNLSLSRCHNIATQWMKDAKEAAGVPPTSKTFTYLCIKR